MWTKEFWVATLERAIRTFAQTLAGLLGGDAINIPYVSSMSFLGMLQVAGLSAFVAVLMAIASNQVTKTGPAITTAEVLSPPGIPTA